MINSNSRFSMNPPRADIRRSSFKRPQQVKFTMSAGKLIPFYVDEVLPGDTFKIDLSALCRMSTPVFPVMDAAFLDVYFFYVPNRLVWEHFVEFMGENKTAPWYSETNANLKIPSITDGLSSGQTVTINVGSVADYFGLPIGSIPYGEQVSDLPFRAYQLIWNEWFRSENLDTPVLVNLGNTGAATVAAGSPYSVARYHDYFSDCLPSPQKGPSVALPLASMVPVVTSASMIPHKSTYPALHFNQTGGTTPTDASGGVFADDGTYNLGAGDVGSDEAYQPSGLTALYPANLWADLAANSAVTVNDMRLAFQTQKLYEADARGGTRYTEILRSHFSVQAPDSRLQRPEYLGGEHIAINVDQVVQTSSTDNTSPQGNTAAYSKTVYRGHAFAKSFVEHGFVIGVCCVRTARSYQQGIERFWSRKSRLDLYWPVLANIGEQPVYRREIFSSSNLTSNKAVFGYQEAWAEYRYKPNRVSGYMRSGVSGSLDSWHYADYYSGAPTLSAAWLAEGNANVARTLAVGESGVADCQFICDFYVNNISVRPMPTYSIPGLIDHH